MGNSNFVFEVPALLLGKLYAPIVERQSTFDADGAEAGTRTSLSRR